MSNIDVIEKLMLYLDKKISGFRKSGKFVINKELQQAQIRDNTKYYILNSILKKMHSKGLRWFVFTA